MASENNSLFNALKKFGKTLGSVINENIPKIKNDLGRIANAVTQDNDQTTYQKVEKLAILACSYVKSKGGKILKETKKRYSENKY